MPFKSRCVIVSLLSTIKTIKLTTTSVLPLSEGERPSYAIPPAEVTKVALRLKYQIEQVIPCELEEWKVC